MSHIIIGKGTYGNVSARGGMNKVFIGKYCSLAINIVVDCGFNHNPKWISTYPFNSQQGYPVPHNAICRGDIIIGNDVWIGEDVTIMSGVNIGNGVIIGAKTVITKDIPPYSIVVGANKIIKKRFTDDQIDDLQKIAWWDFEEDKLKEASILLMSDNINDFIKKYK